MAGEWKSGLPYQENPEPNKNCLEATLQNMSGKGASLVMAKPHGSASDLSRLHSRGIIHGSGEFSLDSTILCTLTFVQSNA